jgi:hypothetical protein
MWILTVLKDTHFIYALRNLKNDHRRCLSLNIPTARAEEIRMATEEGVTDFTLGPQVLVLTQKKAQF